MRPARTEADTLVSATALIQMRRVRDAVARIKPLRETINDRKKDKAIRVSARFDLEMEIRAMAPDLEQLEASGHLAHCEALLTMSAGAGS